MTGLTAQDSERTAAMAASQSDLVAVVPKNKREEIRVSLDLLNGHRLLNMRVFFEGEDGSMHPGKAGIAFKVDKLQAFAEAVALALVTAEKRGYVK
ncbi:MULTISPECIES: transcriptional coactivator p15/PC4 family protein [unclassified Mesorhizobium]|uniref:transcriptional coactivator p15/PC4 family protein n=1 Tax=unclassified Mesorhizobium TaxID=325217 RepID=UPI000F759B9A|nr:MULTISPECIES: transcriptional coactivator p15/PC4 family protein [unclassified Mesorhizobium]AZO51231.1 hypothetical protein EJ073_28525 [Mesorhizobium sp. M4B.F.Ca.ET.058.02.1.1]RVC45464.1 hypothetical protein EN781_09720 [Mesorhizobium sp. M4A.F.Ca.ET.090.04.2.1]